MEYEKNYLVIQINILGNFQKYTGDFVFKTNLLTYITQDKWMNIRIFDSYPLRQSYMAEILAF